MNSFFEDIKNSLKRPNSYYVQLIVINVVAFVSVLLIKLFLELTQNGAEFIPIIEQNVVLNARFTDFIRHPWTVISFMFSNAGFWELVFNALALSFFGYVLQDFIGGIKVLNAYLLGSLFSAFVYIIVFNVLEITQGINSLSAFVAGASAGVYSIIFAIIAISSDFELQFFRRFTVKLKYLALVFLIFSFLSFSNGLIAFFGAVFGYTYIKLNKLGIDVGAPFQALANFIIKLFRRKPKLKEYREYADKEYAETGQYTKSEKPLRTIGAYPTQAEVDELLDKISLKGYDSLSLEEKKRLHLASKKKE